MEHTAAVVALEEDAKAVATLSDFNAQGLAKLTSSLEELTSFKTESSDMLKETLGRVEEAQRAFQAAHTAQLDTMLASNLESRTTAETAAKQAGEAAKQAGEAAKQVARLAESWESQAADLAKQQEDIRRDAAELKKGHTVVHGNSTASVTRFPPETRFAPRIMHCNYHGHGGVGTTTPGTANPGKALVQFANGGSNADARTKTTMQPAADDRGSGSPRGKVSQPRIPPQGRNLEADYTTPKGARTAEDATVNYKLRLFFLVSSTDDNVEGDLIVRQVLYGPEWGGMLGGRPRAPRFQGAIQQAGYLDRNEWMESISDINELTEMLRTGIIEPLLSKIDEVTLGQVSEDLSVLARLAERSAKAKTDLASKLATDLENARTALRMGDVASRHVQSSTQPLQRKLPASSSWVILHTTPILSR